MLKNQTIVGFFLSEERYSVGQNLKKGVVSVYEDIKGFNSDVMQNKTIKKEGTYIIKISVCKKSIYNVRKRQKTFALKTKSDAFVLEVTPAGFNDQTKVKSTVYEKFVEV